MNLSLPDDATIQIFVVPSGASPALDPDTGTPRMMLAPPARNPSRRRDVLFLGAGVVLSVAVLTVVRFQQTSPTNPIRSARAVSSGPQDVIMPSPALPRPLPDRADSTTPTYDADPREAVRRLLAERPTLTPPPGAPIPQTVPVAPEAQNPTPGQTPAKRNAFGMSD